MIQKAWLTAILLHKTAMLNRPMTIDQYQYQYPIPIPIVLVLTIVLETSYQFYWYWPIVFLSENIGIGIDQYFSKLTIDIGIANTIVQLLVLLLVNTFFAFGQCSGLNE